MKKKEEIKIVYKPIDELIDAEYNPKKCSPKEENDIRNSIMRFGIVDPIIVNMHEGRENIIVGGHQRKRICKDLGYEEMPCVIVDLDLEHEKELNVRLSKNTASIDEAKLAKNFEKAMLEAIGFGEAQLKSFISEYEEKFNKITNADCAYPLVPKFSEKYDCIIIVSTNTIDTTFMENALKVTKSQSYKNSRTGKAMVISVEQFKQALAEL